MEISVKYSTENQDKIRLTSNKEAFQLILTHWNLDIIEFQEECKVILLNRGNFVIGIYEVSKGGIEGTVVDIRIILSVALKCNATQLILVHNHPSGNLNPSNADEKITKRLENACKIIGIKLLDHLIITKNDYYSFKKENSF